MASDESTDADQRLAAALAEARRLLRPPQPVDQVWAALAAAALFSICAMIFATTAILAPPPKLTVPAAAQAVAPAGELRGAT